MNHEQVRAWILEGETTDPTTSRLAAEHLSSCSDCQAFSAGWASARLELDKQPVVGPEAGFRFRWDDRLHADRQRRHRRQTALALTGTLLGSISVLAAMVWLVLEAPARVAGMILGQLAGMDAQLNVLVDSLRIVAAALPPLANLGLMWAGVAGALGLILLYTGFSALWTASFYRAVLQTRTKEN